MKLLFKQRIFSWLDSYDIYDENENTVYTIKGQLSWGIAWRYMTGLAGKFISLKVLGCDMLEILQEKS